MQLTKAPSGIDQIVFCECEWDDIPTVSASIIKRIDATLLSQVEGIGEWMAIVQIGEQTFCLSWDDWLHEMTLMHWNDTPNEAVMTLYRSVSAAHF